jgi:SsrA-binding protein
MSKSHDKPRQHEPTIENRKARHDYHIDDTLECGIRLTGTEIKSVRASQISLNEGFVTAVEIPPTLILHNTHIHEYAPAGKNRQHVPTRNRVLLAHRKEILKLVTQTRARGTTLVPLKMYFVRGKAKLLIGVARGKKQADKREAIAKREHQRDIERAMSRKR